MEKTRCLGVLAILVLVVPISAQTEDAMRTQMAGINTQLEAGGGNVRVATVEYYTAWSEAGQIVYFNDRTLRMGSDWVPFDPYRGGTREITWLSDQREGAAGAVALPDTQTAVSNAMETWDSVACADIPLVQLWDYGIDWGYVQYLLGFGGVGGWYADITHAGWLPGTFFDLLGGPGASNYIIGVTFTFIWVNSETGEPTDMDNNGKLDVAFRETYYNNQFSWGIDTSYPIDVETVVLHESGHGLSLGHFGKLFKTDANGKLHFAPLAVMNAGYTGIQQALEDTDFATFCSVWSSWPNH